LESQESAVSTSRQNAANGQNTASDDLTAHVYHAELNRIRFLLRAYYRTRLFKIENHSVYVLKEPDVLANLSEQEKEYATNYADVVEEHFHSVLSQMPEGYGSMLQQIEEDEGTWDMVPEPDLDAHVFCRVKEDKGDVMLDPNDPENTMDLERNDILMIRYRLIKKLLFENAVDLM
jgi:GINS complex subunit 4